MSKDYRDMPKEILFATHVGNPGGAEIVMLRLCESVKNSCTVLLYEDGELNNLIHELGVKSKVCELSVGITNIRRKSGLLDIVRLLPSLLRSVFQTYRLLERVDIVVCMSQKSYALVAIANIFSRKKIIWFMNDLVSPESFGKPLLFLMTRIFPHFAEVVVLNSKASHDAWKKYSGNIAKSIVIYPGTDVEKIDEYVSNNVLPREYENIFNDQAEPLVGMFGRISHWKGQDVFLKALSQVEGVRGVIVGGAHFGEESYLESLKDMCILLGITDRVFFIGHINEVPVAMSRCRIVVHASTLPEPFGLVIAEAMMSGVPIIASDAGGAREIVINNETGLLTPPGDIQALADAIERLISDVQLSEYMSVNARIRAENMFSNDNMISRFKDIIINIRN